MGCSLRWLLLLWSVGSVTAAHGSGCSAACGILLDQELNPCPLLWQTDAWTLGHREVPMLTSWGFTKLCSPLQLLVVPRGRREYLFPLLILPVVHSALYSVYPRGGRVACLTESLQNTRLPLLSSSPALLGGEAGPSLVWYDQMEKAYWFSCSIWRPTGLSSLNWPLAEQMQIFVVYLGLFYISVVCAGFSMLYYRGFFWESRNLGSKRLWGQRNLNFVNVAWTCRFKI